MAKLRASARTVLKQLPFGERYLRARSIAKNFSVEIDLLKGVHSNSNTHSSIIHFSLNKAATQYTKSILRRCASHNGMVPVRISDYAFSTNLPYLHDLSVAEMIKYRHIFKMRGYLYSVFGEMVEGIVEFDRYIVVLMIRDPRDILVSDYYSVAYSHVAPDKSSRKYDEFLAQRARALNMTVDEYAVAECDRVYGILERYKKLLIDKHPNTYVTSYEEMATNFPAWLKGLLEHCQLSITDTIVDSLVSENSRLKPAQEDVYRHIRRAKVGDFREKLGPSTINLLSKRLAPMLETFGYA